MKPASQCWCGQRNLLSFSPAYLKCQTCETLIAAQMPDTNIANVSDEAKDFYGREYWYSHLEHDYGQPNIMARARTDLPERCLHWLRTVLKYKPPPAEVLEIGSAHGGFVAMLRWAGFNAIGLELSLSIVEFARQTFDVPMLLGPVEEQKLEPGSLDAIVLMDVLEHLQDPVSTIRHCLNLLKRNGILVIQTPCLPERKSYAEMVDQGDIFIEQLKENEHLYLFSRSAVKRFFGLLGVEQIEFEPAIFAVYDMCLIASRRPLQTNSQEQIEKALGVTPEGRMTQALLDLDDQHQKLKKVLDRLPVRILRRLKMM